MSERFHFAERHRKSQTRHKWQERNACELNMSVCVYLYSIVCAGALMVCRKKLWLLLLCALSNHQHYWLSELHLNMVMVLVAIVCASVLSLSPTTTMIFHSPQKPIFRSVTHILTSTSTFRHLAACWRRAQTYLSIFIRISHFNFVTLAVFLYRSCVSFLPFFVLCAASSRVH